MICYFVAKILRHLLAGKAENESITVSQSLLGTFPVLIWTRREVATGDGNRSSSQGIRHFDNGR